MGVRKPREQRRGAKRAQKQQPPVLCAIRAAVGQRTLRSAVLPRNFLFSREKHPCGYGNAFVGGVMYTNVLLSSRALANPSRGRCSYFLILFVLIPPSSPILQVSRQTRTVRHREVSSCNGSLGYLFGLFHRPGAHAEQNSHTSSPI